jgi:hypothetical protein
MSVLFLYVHTESVTICPYAYVTGLLEKHSHCVSIIIFVLLVGVTAQDNIAKRCLSIQTF